MTAPWLLVVNTIQTMSPSQSTSELAARISERGHPLYVVPCDGFDTQRDGTLLARGRRVSPTSRIDPKDLVAMVRSAPAETVPVDDAAIVLIRTNPGRGGAAPHQILLDQLATAAARGVPVLNDPRGLMSARSKLYLSRLPEHTRPPTLVTRSAEAARAFIGALGGRAVLKPLVGTRGRDVFLVNDAHDPNLNQILDVLFRNGFAMVQGFVPEAREGDTRLLLVDGQLLERNGQWAAVRRVPSGADFRSNVHVGGQPAPAPVTDRLRQLAKDVGPTLRADGLFLVGLDVIGDVVVECNVFSPGGFHDAERFTGVDFLAMVVDAMERHARS